MPFVLWYFVFRAPVFGFWPTLTFSALRLLLISLPRLRLMGFRVALRDIALGIVSGIALYLFFWSGYQVAKSVPGFVQTISSVYGLRGGAPPQEITLLLLFPIGPTEELYWRGLIQRRIREGLGPNRSLIVTTLLYTAIHLPTFNPSLLLVAAIGGLVWGAIYNRCGSVVPGIVSHVIFDEMIFVFFVIG